MSCIFAALSCIGHFLSVFSGCQCVQHHGRGCGLSTWLQRSQGTVIIGYIKQLYSVACLCCMSSAGCCAWLIVIDERSNNYPGLVLSLEGMVRKCLMSDISQLNCNILSVQLLPSNSSYFLAAFSIDQCPIFCIIIKEYTCTCIIYQCSFALLTGGYFTLFVIIGPTTQNYFTRVSCTWTASCLTNQMKVKRAHHAHIVYHQLVKG